MAGGHVPVGDEDEQVLPEALDDALEFPACLGGGGDLEQSVEVALEPGVIGEQGGVGQPGAAVADADRTLEQVLDVGSEGVVAGVDGIPDVAQQVGEADLMLLAGPSPLCSEPAGNPEGRPDLAEERGHHGLAARGADDEAGAVGVVEDPGPEGLLADTHAGLVGGRTVPDSRCCLIRLVWAASGWALSSSRLASEPSLMSNPNRSCIRRARRSKGMTCPKRR